MTDKTQPTAHAEITAPFSADLRGIEGASPVSQAVRLLREAAAELKNCHTIGGDWGDEIEALDAYNEHMAVAATLEQAEAGQAVPAPVTYMATDNACKWAWDQVRKDVGTEGWTTSDSCNFYGFFLWGWNYRGQYETQRLAAPPAPAAVAVPAASEVLDALNYVDDFIARCNGDDRGSCASVNLLRAALAAAPAQAVAVPELAKRIKDCAGHWAYMERIDHGDQAAFEKQRHAELVDQLAAPAQEHATQLAGQALPADEFRGDTDSLVRNIVALLDLDAQGCLVPHGVGGHARGLLSAAASRLAASDQAQGCTRSHPHENMSPMCGLRTEIARLNHAAAIAQATAAPAQAQEDARDLEAEALRACRDLPEGWEIEIHLERGYGVVTVIDPQGNDDELPVEGALFDALKETIDTAIRDDAARAAQGGAA